MENNPNNHGSQNGVDIKNQTIHGGNQQFSDKIVNIYSVKYSNKIFIGLAIVIVILGLLATMQAVSDVRAQREKIGALLATGKRLQDEANYALALSTLEQALAMAEQKQGVLPGLFYRAEAERARVQQAQLGLSITWLQFKGPIVDKTSAESVDKLIVILSREAERAAGSAKADMLAYITWANYVKAGGGRLYNPESGYRGALALDANNTYANAYLGYWLLAYGGNREAGKIHLLKAIQTNRELPLVFDLSLAAARKNWEGTEYLFFANEMRKKNIPISVEQLSRVRTVFSTAFSGSPPELVLKNFRLLVASVPAKEQIELIKKVDQQKDSTTGHDHTLDMSEAILLELAGQREQAVKIWTALLADLPKDRGYENVITMATQALTRLSAKAG